MTEDKFILRPENSPFAGIYRAVRKELDLTQAEMSNMMALSQGALSKIEAGKMIPSVFQWLHFANFFDLSPYCYKEGFLDVQKIRHVQESLGRPIKENNLKGLSVRTLVPLLNYFINKMPKDEYRRYLRSLGLSYDFTVIREHSIAVEVLCKIAEQFKAADQAAFLASVSEMAKTEQVHGHKLFSKYQKATTVEDRLKMFVETSSSYDNTCHYKLDFHNGKISIFRSALDDKLFSWSKNRQKECLPFYNRYLSHFLMGIGSMHQEKSTLALVENESEFEKFESAHYCYKIL